MLFIYNFLKNICYSKNSNYTNKIMPSGSEIEIDIEYNNIYKEYEDSLSVNNEDKEPLSINNEDEYWYCLSNNKHHKSQKLCRCIMEEWNKKN